MDDEDSKLLIVCYSKPDRAFPKGSLILSFLGPKDEQDLLNKGYYKVICGREEILKVKKEALDSYIRFVSHIGIAKDSEGITFRRRLEDKDGVSAWWYHPVAIRDSENDPTFERIIQILAIDHVAQSNRINSLVICGASYEVGEVLKSKYLVARRHCRKTLKLVSIIIALLKRLKYTFGILYDVIVIKKYMAYARQGSDVLFTGFWDWSVKEDAQTKAISDLFYKKVPDKLRDKDVSVSWLAWFYKYYDPNGGRRTIKKMLEPLKRHPEILIAQSYLSICDIIRRSYDLRAYIVFCDYKRNKSFAGVFKAHGLDFWKIFDIKLQEGFLSGAILQFQLIEQAYKKAAAEIKPKKVITFMNFFPFARAVYAGVKRADAQCRIYDIQHASYSWEKTIGALDAEIEFNGLKDGCRIPQADYMCVMGDLGCEVFMKSGFPKDRIFRTGSSRYDMAFDDRIDERIKKQASSNILVATALRKDNDLEMVDVVYHSLKDFDQAHIRLRPHPFSRLHLTGQLNPYLNKIHISENKELNQDLDWADVVIFSYSTVAEEAFIKGIPVWQWASLGANASIFRGTDAVPIFSSISGLKSLYDRFIKAPQDFMPDVGQRQFIKRRCFYAEEGSPSDNIVRILMQS